MRWKQYLDAASKWLTSAQFTSILQAVAAGVGLIFGVSLAIGTVGFSVWAVAGLLLAAAVGLDVAWRSAPVSSHIRTLFKVSLVAWIFLAPALADAAFSLSGALLRTAAASTMGSVVTGLLVGLVTLAMPGFLVGLSIAQSNRFSVRSLLGIGLGIAFAPLLPIASLGAHSLALLTAAVAAVFEIARAILGRDSEFEVATANKNASSAYATLLSYFGILTAGASIAILARVLNQTMPASLQAMAWGMAAVLAGTVIGYRRSQRNTSALTVCYALLAISLSSAFLLFPQIVQTQLAVNAKVSIAPAVFALRGLLTALIMLPAGLVVGCSLSSLKSANGGFPSPGMTAVCGLVAAWFICPVVGSSVLAMMLIAVVGVLTVASVRASSVHWVPKSTAGWTAVVLAVVAAIATPFGVNRFDTELSSQLLFSSAVFREYANGTESHLLLATNDGRRLSTYESADGVSSAWRYAGTRIQVRQNGIPVSVTSTDVSTCPQSASAIMPVVLPLLLHESAENILLLGDVGPAAEATSLMFPITSVTTLSRDTRTSDEVDQHFKARHADDRFTKVVADPNIGLSGVPGQFDVIVSRPVQPALPAAAPYYAPEFHSRIAKRLTAGGLFCQSFNQTDFGSAPLHRVLASMRKSFKSVSAIQVNGAELLIIATNGETVIRPGLAQRTSRGHVRRILAELGWDWSRVFQLASLDLESTEAIAASSPGMNTASNAAFLWGLPLETMSWKNKAAELQATIAPYERSVLTQLAEDEYRHEAARRIKEVGQEAEILFGFPDEPWMYRKSLRTRMEQHSRPPQEVVERGSVKRKPHPVDQYRIDYFQSLSRAVKAGGRDEQAIAQLTQFTTPIEPLVSYFANHELVRILEASELSPATEFQHRLHTIYFVPGQTRSVREVVAAMNLLVDHPEIVADPAARWDQMNSLFQILMGRWAARRDIPPRSSHVALNDIEKSLLAIESSLKAMDEWRTEAAIDVDLCENREVFLRRRLERPLRRYQEELLPHHYKNGDQKVADDEVVDQFRYLGN